MLGQPEAVARELNSLLRNFSAQPFVTEAFTLEWQPCETGSQSELLAAEAALGLAGALKSAGPERLKTCAASPCQDVFIDGSRNRSRRFCSERCANRYHAAAFRDRR
jgi:predicted RNA-binding Zn ribbon-like protein